MAWNRRIFISLIAAAVGATVISCDRTSLQRTLSADPKASQWKSTPANVQLPADFPETLRYPNARLRMASPLPQPSSASVSVAQGYQTQWSTADSQAQVLAFYRERLQLPQWQGFKEVSGDGVILMSAEQPTQQVSISLPQSSSLASPQPTPTPIETQFTLTYQKGSTASSRPPEASSQPSSQNANAELGLTQVPPSLQPYLQDVAQLEVLPNLESTPNQSISRAQFARWLVELNNRIYRDRPARQIRLGTASKPVFSDVPANHPDFAYIQGLAESGYLPSPLSGDSTQARFRPSAPLTRETLLLWKVPIDRQQVLPTVSAERVKQLWGFKDTNRISAAALSAVAADRQNGDLSNIRRVLGATLLFQPQKPVTQAEAAAALWFIGTEGDSLSVRDLLRSEQQEEAATPSPSSGPKSSKSLP